jgi:hypothetical protein
MAPSVLVISAVARKHEETRLPKLSSLASRLRSTSRTVQDGMMNSWREKGYVPDSDEEDDGLESQPRSIVEDEAFTNDVSEEKLEDPVGIEKVCKTLSVADSSINSAC